MPQVNSQRTNVLSQIVSLCNKVGDGAYFVRRGAINWSEFDFSQHRAGISILTPEFTLLGREFNSMVITLEICQKILSTDRSYDLADGLTDLDIEGLVEDARVVIVDLSTSRDASGNPYILRIVDNKIDGQELANLDFSIQGVNITFSVEY